MAWKQLRPQRGVGARVHGLVVTVGKSGNLYFSRDFESEFGVSTEKAATIFFDEEAKELAIEFTDRGGRDRSQLFEDGLLAVTKVGSSHQLTAKSVLRMAGVTAPEKSVRIKAEAKEIQATVGKPKHRVAAIDITPLRSEAASA